jgi:hypothetical protein
LNDSLENFIGRRRFFLSYVYTVKIRVSVRHVIVKVRVRSRLILLLFSFSFDVRFYGPVILITGCTQQ